MVRKLNHLVMFMWQSLGALFAIFSLLIAFTFLLVSLTLSVAKMSLSAKLLFKWAMSLDQTANAFLNGNEDLTVSGRLGRRILIGEATKAELWLCKVLSKIDTTSKSHCVDSIEYDEVGL